MGRFKYKIETQNFDNQFIDAPDGWAEDESIFPRSEDYKGIFRKFSANSLKFYESGADLLRQIFAQSSFESVAEFIIFETDFDTYEDSVRFKGSFDFVTYKDTSDNKGKNIQINVIDSSFWNKIKNRDKIRPQLSQLVSLNEYKITGFSNENQTIVIPSIPETLQGSANVDNPPDITFNHAVPLKVTYGNDVNLINVVDYEALTDVTGAFYVVNTLVYELEVGVGATIRVNVDQHSPTVYVKLKHFGISGSLKTTEILTQATGVFPFPSLLIFEFQTTKTFTGISIGDYFILTVEGSATTLFEVEPPYYAAVVTRSIVDFLETITVSGMLIHEALSRNLQLISDTDLPLYSKLLGRTNSEPRSYAENGELSNLLITNGKRIRGFTDDETPIVMGLSECFNSLNAIRPIGIGIETIDGKQTVRLEEQKYFYDDRVILTFDNASNIIESVIDNMIINKITVGYNKFDYEEINGLNEFNQQSEFSTPIQVVSNELDIVSPFRSDNNGIVNARKKPKRLFPTEDTKYDTDNFMIVVTEGSAVNLAVNGDFESWSSENTPDNWYVYPGTSITRKSLLGSNKCYFKTPNFINLNSISHEVNINTGTNISIQFSYENIGTSDINPYFSLRVEDGTTVYFYDFSTKKWNINTGVPIFFNVGLIPTSEFVLQSMKSFSISTEEHTPISGTLKWILISGAGLIIDDLYIGESNKFTAKTNEGYTSIQNSSFDEYSLNLDITPARNLLNHGSEIRAGLENNLSKLIRFNNSEKDSTLRTTKTGEEPVIENADIQVNKLSEPYYKPIQLSIDCEIDKYVVDTLNDTFPGETKPKYLGIVRFRQSINENYKYIWIQDMKTGGEMGQGSIIGIEVNTNYITPV